MTRTRFFMLLLSSLFIMGCDRSAGPEGGSAQTERPAYVLAIHGGAGTIRRDLISEEKEAAIRAALDSALTVGEAVLSSDGSALDAVEQVIRFLEDSPHFNAGRGSVYTHEGTNEMDAAIMDGRDLNAGAVTGLRTIRHPVSAARAVMERSKHVFLSGPGAEAFARSQGLDTVDPAFFHTPWRYESLQKVLGKEPGKMGTVGAVALDRQGNLAAATSTGGMTNKMYGRIGDVPVIGAGTYANNGTCAVSCTGHGEYFIRHTVAHDLSARMAYAGMDLREAAARIIQEKLVEAGGSGGLIAVDRNGNWVLEFNTPGMYRGVVAPGHRETRLYQ